MTFTWRSLLLHLYIIEMLASTDTVRVFGAFSIFGFVLLLQAVFNTYKNKKCTIFPCFVKNCTNNYIL